MAVYRFFPALALAPAPALLSRRSERTQETGKGRGKGRGKEQRVWLSRVEHTLRRIHSN